MNNLKYINLNIIAQNSSIKGEIQLVGESIVSGKVDGQINVMDESKITFEAGSHFNGILYAYDVEILGNFEGHLKATGKVIVRPGAKVMGNIQANNLVVYPGAILEIEGHTANDL